jgi:antitoxin component of MazEF toxin-antitoxin module
MTLSKTRKWGNSLGVIIPKNVVDELHLTENQEVIINIQPKEHVLKELWGFAKGKIKEPTGAIIAVTREEMGVD